MDSIENYGSNNSSIVVCIRCHGNAFTEPLLSTDRRDTHTDTQDWWEGVMKYAVEMGPGAMI
jgi:hypothetical protein